MLTTTLYDSIVNFRETDTLHSVKARCIIFFTASNYDAFQLIPTECAEVFFLRDK